jgi:hypothetical protein
VLESSRPVRAIALLSCLIILGVLGSCTSPEEGTPQPAGAIRILQPGAGGTFGLADTIDIVVESDFDRFSSGITFEYTLDSARTWEFIRSLPRKPGVVKDTLPWAPGLDFPEVLGDGRGVMLRVFDYDRDFSDQTGFFHFRK